MAAPIPQESVETASQRAPVEIWSRILAFAISCPLLPSDDDNLIANIYLLQYDCEFLALYWESERFRLSCRLVCQSWKKALDVYSHRCFVGRKDDPQIKCYRRIQFPSFIFKWNPCHHDYDKVPGCPSIPREPAQDDKQFSPNSVYAFVDPDNCSGRKMLDITTRFPSLQLLSLHAFEDWEDLRRPISLPFLSSELASLTHLALSGFYQTATGEDQILTLPNLRTLLIEFSERFGGSPRRHPPFRKWALPKLRNLGVRGNDGTKTYDEVQLLIQNVGGTLKGLSLGWVRAIGVVCMPGSLWDWCPRLRFLEASTSAIRQIWPPPATHHGLVMVLIDLRYDLRWTGDVLSHSITLLKDTISSKQTKIDGHSFSMPISWSALQQRLECWEDPRTFSQFSVPLLQLLTCLQEYGYALTDRHGVGLETVEARQFIEWVSVRV